MAFYQFLPSYGGIEKHILSISKELSKRNHKVSVITTNLFKLRPSNLTAAENYGDIKVMRFRAFMLRNWMPICPAAFFKHLPACDLLHIHSINLNVFMLPLQIRGQLKRLPIVITPHMHPDRLSAEYHHPLYRAYLREVVPMLLKKADAVIALTPSEKKYYEDSGISGVFEIPNGVDLNLHRIESSKLIDFAKAHDSETKKVLFVGRMDENKGLQTVIRSLPQVLKRHKDLKLYAVGAYTEYASQLQSLVRELNCSDDVRFFFNVPNEDLPYFYEISDLVVMPSRQVEAQGIVLLESWAHKKPVLAINRGGMKDLISQGGGQVLNSFTRDSWGSMISEMLDDEHELRKLGNEGYKLVLEKYTWKHVADKIEKTYISAIRKHGLAK